MCRIDGDPLAAIDQGLEVLSRLDPAVLSGPALADRIARVKRQINRLDGQLTRMVAAFDAAGSARRDGFRDTRGWLRAALNESAGEANRRAQVARGMTTLQDTANRLTSGQISLGHAAVIAKTAEHIGAAAMTAGAEARLLSAAERSDPAELAKVADRIRHEIDADALAVDLLEQRARRTLRVSRSAAGPVHVEGRLDQESGETLLSALMPLTKPAGAADERTIDQRMADALTDLARLALDAKLLPDVHGERPHISVIAPLATLRRLPGAPPADGAWTGPLAADTLRRLACDAQISRIITGPDSEPLDVGRATRVETPAIRRARVARDRHCRFPGCRRPAAWTTGHHIRHWADGGPTALTNIVSLCTSHHIQVHEGRWRIVGDPNTNDLWFVAPDGHRLHALLPAADEQCNEAAVLMSPQEVTPTRDREGPNARLRPAGTPLTGVRPGDRRQPRPVAPLAITTDLDLFSSVGDDILAVRPLDSTEVAAGRTNGLIAGSTVTSSQGSDPLALRRRSAANSRAP